MTAHNVSLTQDNQICFNTLSLPAHKDHKEAKYFALTVYTVTIL